MSNDDPTRSDVTQPALPPGGADGDLPSELGLSAGAGRTGLGGAADPTIALPADLAPDPSTELRAGPSTELRAGPSTELGAGLGLSAGAGCTGGGPRASDTLAGGLAPGSVLGGRYVVRALLARGGMGAVYRVHDRTRGIDVALKVMLPSLLLREKAAQRFRHEAEISLRLTHDGIVRVHDVHEDPETGLRYLTMELLDGVTLRDWLEARRQAGEAVEPLFALEVAGQVLEALIYAHRITVHRDLKPENIVLLDPGTPHARAKVLDFGIAKLKSAPQFTADAMTLGTAYYMAPEQQHDAAHTDVQADVYSVCVILYEMLTGRLPVGRFHAPSEVRPGLPRVLDQVILRGLEPDAARRTPSAGALRDELAAVRRILEGGRRRRAVRAALGLVAVAVLAAAAVVLIPVLSPEAGPGLAAVSQAPSASPRAVAPDPGTTVFAGAPAERPASDRPSAPDRSSALPVTSSAVPPVPAVAPAPATSTALPAAVPVPGPAAVRASGPAAVPGPGSAATPATIAPASAGADRPRVELAFADPADGFVSRADALTVTARVRGLEPGASVVAALVLGCGIERAVEVKVAAGEDLVRLGPLPLLWAEGPCRIDLRAAGATLASVSGKVERAWPEPAAGIGWWGEPMPKGVARAAARPFYTYDSWKGLKVEMAYVPPGDFLMGSADPQAEADERPRHVHAMPRGYYAGRREVTVGEFERFVDASGYRTAAERQGWSYGLVDGHWTRATGRSWRDPGFKQTASDPVVCVSWADAEAFCRWAGLQLPTEPEWEKAARGVDGRAFPWGPELDPERANFCDSSCPADVPWKDAAASDGHPYTAPVGSFAAGASPFGLLDAVGNVWEWCEDTYAEDTYARFAAGSHDAAPTGALRVFRGGGWASAAKDGRTTFRGRDAPASRNSNLGFRVVLRVTE